MFTNISNLSEKQRAIKFTKKMIEIICLIVLISTLLSLLGKYPYFELFTHFKFQYVWLSLVCIIMLGFFHSWSFFAVSILCFLFNGFYLMPYYPSAEKTTLEKNLRLMQANVEGNNKKYDGLIQAVRAVNPDILLLQETTDEWKKQVQTLKSDYQYFEEQSRSGGAGMILFSRYPIEKIEVISFDSSHHFALFSRIKVNGVLLSLLAIHPPTPVRTDKFINRNKQFAQAAEVIKSADEPKLIIGDFNTTMWSPYFVKLVKDSGLRDVREGRGLYQSWHSILPGIFRIPIDHCLISKEIEINNVELGEFTGSDHRPLVLDLKLEK